MFINEWVGDFDVTKIPEGYNFGWARNGEFIDKEIVYTVPAKL
jgi:hypothetical protein